MTKQTTRRWARLRDFTNTLGDAVSTPRGVAPHRDPLAEVLRREHT
jgi:hypothetical protein